MLSGHRVWLACRQTGGGAVRSNDEAPWPGQHGLEPASHPHFTSRFAELAAMAHTDCNGAEILYERTLIVFAEQRSPGDEPVLGNLHRQRMPAQPADALA